MHSGKPCERIGQRRAALGAIRLLEKGNALLESGNRSLICQQAARSVRLPTLAASGLARCQRRGAWKQFRQHRRRHSGHDLFLERRRVRVLREALRPKHRLVISLGQPHRHPQSGPFGSYGRLDDVPDIQPLADLPQRLTVRAKACNRAPPDHAQPVGLNAAQPRQQLVEEPFDLRIVRAWDTHGIEWKDRNPGHLLHWAPDPIPGRGGRNHQDSSGQQGACPPAPWQDGFGRRRLDRRQETIPPAR